MSDDFRKFDFTSEDSFSEFSSLESRLFAAGEFPETATDEDSAWPASAEEEIVAFADEPPKPRAGLRSEFLAEVCAIERRRERLRKLPVIAACVLAATVGFFRPVPPTPQTVTGLASQNGELPIAAGVPDELFGQFVLADSRAAVEAAGRTDDNWALVDACRNLRTRQYLSLQKSISSRSEKK